MDTSEQAILDETLPTENSISVKKGEVKQLRQAHHSVCRSVVASPAAKTRRDNFSGVADGAEMYLAGREQNRAAEGKAFQAAA